MPPPDSQESLSKEAGEEEELLPSSIPMSTQETEAVGEPMKQPEPEVKQKKAGMSSKRAALAKAAATTEEEEEDEEDYEVARVLGAKKKKKKPVVYDAATQKGP